MGARTPPRASRTFASNPAIRDRLPAGLPDERPGEIPAAIIELKPGYEDTTEDDINELAWSAPLPATSGQRRRSLPRCRKPHGQDREAAPAREVRGGAPGRPENKRCPGTAHREAQHRRAVRAGRGGAWESSYCRATRPSPRGRGRQVGGNGLPRHPSTETLENLCSTVTFTASGRPTRRSSPRGKYWLCHGRCAHAGHHEARWPERCGRPPSAMSPTRVSTQACASFADDPLHVQPQNEQDEELRRVCPRAVLFWTRRTPGGLRLRARKAFDISERFDAPVILHETMRIAHTRTMVERLAARARP